MKIREQDAHNNFTILRLFLAVMVVFGHFKLLAGDGDPPWPFVYAGVAVDCFFVVSGFLITLSFDRDMNFQRYYLRRFFRIYPLYIVVVIAQTLILGALAHGGIIENLPEMMRYFAANAVFANFLHHDIGDVIKGLPNPSFNASLWTLKIEFAFYLLLPFLWLALRRFGGGLLVAIFVASAVYFWTLKYYGQNELARQLPGQLQFFVLGVAAYRYRDRLHLDQRVGILLVPILGLVLTLLLPFKPVFVYPLVVGAFVVVMALNTPAFNLRDDFSYGVYLLHAPIIQLLLLSGFYRPDGIGLALVLLTTAVLALIAERVIETPAIAAGRRLAQQVHREILTSSQSAETL